MRDLHDDIHTEFDEARDANKRVPLGPERILDTDPFARVLHSKHGRAPTVLALDITLRRETIAQLRALEALWRDPAAAAFKRLTRGKATRATKLPAMYWSALAL